MRSEKNNSLTGISAGLLAPFFFYGYPAYAHARGYGLFSVNNFGQNSYDPKKEKVKFVFRYPG
jgi:hypothetical protein